MQYKVYSGTNLVDVIGSGRNYLLSSDTTITIDGDTQHYHPFVVPTAGTWTFSTNAKYTRGTQQVVSIKVFDTDVKVLLVDNLICTIENGRISTTFSVNQDNTRLLMYAGPRSYQDTPGNTLSVDHYKLEKGNVATDWSPAPEDLGLDPTQNNLHGYQLTGLTPATSYTMSVVANNGLRDSSKASVTFTTADTVVIPKALTVGSTVSLSYVEYALGLVPIGNEPSGDFGGTKAKILTGKVASVSGSNSTIEFSGVTFAAGKAMTLNAGGVYMAVDGYKSIYYKA